MKNLALSTEEAVAKNRVTDPTKPNCKMCQNGTAILMKWSLEEKIDKRTKNPRLSWFCVKKNCYIHRRSTNTCPFKCWTPMVKTSLKNV
jgi:hypothetical protein